jgi:hypothetical protein
VAQWAFPLVVNHSLNVFCTEVPDLISLCQDV